MNVLRNLVSGEWRDAPHLIDYRIEWLSNMVVERATWDATASTRAIGDQVIANPGYIWMRFWLLEPKIVLEKYFSQDLQAVGYYLPICMPVQRRSDQLLALSLYLAIWLKLDNRMMILRETRFEEAVATGELAPVESEHAEYQIRELTTAIARSTFPPAIVRNFALQ
jgi:predicted RNA-binding protein associated with RNAse of E/G family